MEMGLRFLCDEPFTIEHQSAHKNIRIVVMEKEEEEPDGEGAGVSGVCFTQSPTHSVSKPLNKVFQEHSDAPDRNDEKPYGADITAVDPTLDRQFFAPTEIAETMQSQMVVTKGSSFVAVADSVSLLTTEVSKDSTPLHLESDRSEFIPPYFEIHSGTETGLRNSASYPPTTTSFPLLGDAATSFTAGLDIHIEPFDPGPPPPTHFHSSRRYQFSEVFAHMFTNSSFSAISYTPRGTNNNGTPPNSSHSKDSEEPLNGFLKGRSDNMYERFQWQPKNCNMPRLKGIDMLEILRGKDLVLVGDLTHRNMWNSWVCILIISVDYESKIFDAYGRQEFLTEDSYSSFFIDYNCSTKFVCSPFLVQDWKIPGTKGLKRETIHFDWVERSCDKYKTANGCAPRLLSLVTDLAGRIAMVDPHREVVGAVLKYMGASYNSNDINLEVNGGRNAVKHNLALLAKLVWLFDSISYLKAFEVGYAWVAVEENSKGNGDSDMICQKLHVQQAVIIHQGSVYHIWTAEVLTRVEHYKFDHPEVTKWLLLVRVHITAELQELVIGTGKGLFEVKQIGDEFFAFIVAHKEPSACVILLRGASNGLLNEIEGNIHDAISVWATETQGIIISYAENYDIFVARTLQEYLWRSIYAHGFNPAHPLPKRSLLGRKREKYVAILHKKMINRGSVFPLGLIKWKALPPKHGTWKYSSLRTRMFEGAGIVTGNKYAINLDFTFNCHLFLVMCHL